MKLAILSLGLLAAAATSVRADSETLKVKDLPKAVRTTLRAKFPEGKVVKAVEEEEDGKTIYEVVVKVEDKTLDVAVSAKGKLLEIEQTIAVGKLPKAVAAAIREKYPKAKIKKAEQVVKFESEDEDEDEDEDDEDDDEEEAKFFEVVLTLKDKDTLEVKVSPKGKILKVEGDDEDDKPRKKKEKAEDDDDDKPGKKKEKGEDEDDDDKPGKKDKD